MYNFPYEVQVRINGRSAREYLHKNGDTYIEGRKGTDFTLKISNNSNKRILAVPTIDGLSVMDGKEGGYNSGGYILNPWEHINIPGWRLDNNDVAKFYFEDKNKSYASKIKKSGNQGVIGVAIFEEKKCKSTILNGTIPSKWRWGGSLPTRKWGWGGTSPYKPYFNNFCNTAGNNPNSVQLSCSSIGEEVNAEATMDCCMNVSEQGEVNAFSSSIGTGFGKKESHSVVESSFERDTEYPSETFALYYGSKEDLCRIGVFQSNVRKIVPSAFPKETKNYCKPPKNWVR